MKLTTSASLLAAIALTSCTTPSGIELNPLEYSAPTSSEAHLKFLEAPIGVANRTMSAVVETGMIGLIPFAGMYSGGY